jgi:acyl carrier protein
MTGPPRAGVPVTDVRETIMDIVRTHVDREVDPSMDVFDQGVTSLAFLRIVAQINEKYDITMDVAELEEASVDVLSGFVADQLRSENR